MSELVYYFIRPFLGVWKVCVARLNGYLMVRLVIVVSLDTTESTLPKPPDVVPGASRSVDTEETDVFGIFSVFFQQLLC